MSKTHRLSRKRMLIPLGLSLTIAIAYSIWNNYFRIQPQIADILVLEQPAISYGPITLTGSLRKEFVSENQMGYILISETGATIPLNVTGIDHLVGQWVRVQGLMQAIDPETGLEDGIRVSIISLVP